MFWHIVSYCLFDVLYHTILKASVSFISVIPFTVLLSLFVSISQSLLCIPLFISPSLILYMFLFVSPFLSLPPSLHLSVSLFQSFSLSVSLSFLILSLSLLSYSIIFVALHSDPRSDRAMAQMVDWSVTTRCTDTTRVRVVS